LTTKMVHNTEITFDWYNYIIFWNASGKNNDTDSQSTATSPETWCWLLFDSLVEDNNISYCLFLWTIMIHL
jgi:hypothetical protein